MPLFGTHFEREAPNFMVPSHLESGFVVSVPANYGTDGIQYENQVYRIDIEHSTNPHKLTFSDVGAPQDIRARKKIVSVQTRQRPGQTKNVAFTPATTATLPSRLFGT
jgi:hypothetical protein